MINIAHCFVSGQDDWKNGTRRSRYNGMTEDEYIFQVEGFDYVPPNGTLTVRVSFKHREEKEEFEGNIFDCGDGAFDIGHGLLIVIDMHHTDGLPWQVLKSTPITKLAPKKVEQVAEPVE